VVVLLCKLLSGDNGPRDLFPPQPRAALRQLQVSADASAVMGWLTDSDRREQEWRRRVQAHADIREASDIRLPNGRLHFESVHVHGDWTIRQIVEDVAIQERRIERILRGQATRPNFPGRSRWAVKQRITVESLGDATNIKVWTRGRPVGTSLVLYFLLDDLALGRFLTEQASQIADSYASDIASHFVRLRGNSTSLSN